ncbi:anti-sigma B factor RsbW [Metabacillus fastidiosus]|uniref:anti-sigma B factor RsbW n=1 Tax=Metabacillus fastidiosus TaxID=1458 RepID=UPI003D268A24
MKQLVDYIEMRVPAKSEYVAVIRLTLSGIANRMGYEYDAIEDLKIAVSEACTNAVQHAYKNVEDGNIVVGFAIYEGKLEVMIADNGKSFDFEKTKSELSPYSESSPIDDLSEGGLGIYLMETLMDEVRVLNNAGVTVFMVKYLSEERVNHDPTISSYKAN